MVQITPVHDEASPAPADPAPRTRPRVLPATPDAPALPGEHVTLEQALDKRLRAAQARFTGGLSPMALTGAYADWAMHLAAAPGKQMDLVEKAGKKMWRFANYAMHCAVRPDAPATCIDPLPQDKRFRDEKWQKWPFNVMSQAFLLQQQWWHNVTTRRRGRDQPA